MHIPPQHPLQIKALATHRKSDMLDVHDKDLGYTSPRAPVWSVVPQRQQWAGSGLEEKNIGYQPGFATHLLCCMSKVLALSELSASVGIKGIQTPCCSGILGSLVEQCRDRRKVCMVWDTEWKPGGHGTALRASLDLCSAPSPSVHSFVPSSGWEAPGGTEEPDFCTSSLGTKPWAGRKCVPSKPLLGK